jgi:hypothetical protein
MVRLTNRKPKAAIGVIKEEKNAVLEFDGLIRFFTSDLEVEGQLEFLLSVSPCSTASLIIVAVQK